MREPDRRKSALRQRSTRGAGVTATLLLWMMAAVVTAQPASIPTHRLEEAAAKSAAVERRARALTIAADGAHAFAYDARFYDLDLVFDPAQSLLTGRMAMEARANFALSQIRLDLDPTLAVDAVTAGGMPATFSRDTDDLYVDLDRTYALGEGFRVEIVYHGVPGPASALHFSDHIGEKLIWTLSEPYGARSWWPCQDTPADKADSLYADYTVPNNLTAVGNGVLEGTLAGPGVTTFQWRERHPITPYLVSIAAFPYVALTTTYTPLAGGSMPVTLWSFSDQVGLAQPILAMTVEVLQHFASRFGEYPFVDEKYDMAQFIWGGAMENQTATSTCCWSRSLTAHEAAHQWFGDAVTCESFQHIWLNEGFATWGEAIWDEAAGGLPAYRTSIWDNRWYGPGTILVPAGQQSFGRIFDVNLTYNKASWVPHMLRGIFGDATFFAALRAYITDSELGYGTATTADFRDVLERETGRDLDNFFERWIETPYFPTYLYDWEASSSGGWHVDLDIEQIQTQGLYTMPIRIRVQTTAGSEDFVVENSLGTQSYTLPVGAQPTGVALDPDHWILCTREAALRAPSFFRGLLVVNGAPWTLGGELHEAYADSVFSGGLPFTFWDEYPTPATGYVVQLPTPIGHGAVPSEVLQEYSTVVWVGESDLDLWNDASIVSYLRAGGNVLFLGRRGQEYLNPSRSSRLGLRWAETLNPNLAAATSMHPALVAMTVGGAQSGAVFETDFDTSDTELLLSESQSFGVPRGIAAWRHPAGGGTLRPNGAHFAFVSGRPDRWERGAMYTNVRAILLQLFGEPETTTGSGPPPALVTRLLEPAPNPFNPSVTLRWELATPGRVQLRIYDPAGRLVRTVLDAPRPAGPGALTWDGHDDAHRPTASGVYLLRFESNAHTATAKLHLVR